METLSVQKRDTEKSKLHALRKEGLVPGILYGPKLESVALAVELKQFDRVYKEAGESSLVNVEMDGKEFPSLIHEVQRDPMSGRPVHVDFYQPDLTKKVEVTVPVVLEGEAPAVKELSGTLLRNIQEIEVSALPQDLPHEIVVSIEGLKTFEDRILVKDLAHTAEVSFMREQDDVVAKVVPAEDVDAELEAPIGEEVEAEVEGAEEKKEAEGEEKQEETKAEEQKEEADNKKT